MMQTSENEVTDDVLVSFACACVYRRMYHTWKSAQIQLSDSVLVKKRNVKLQIKTVAYKETSDVEPVP